MDKICKNCRFAKSYSDQLICLSARSEFKCQDVSYRDLCGCEYFEPTKDIKTEVKCKDCCCLETNISFGEVDHICKNEHSRFYNLNVGIEETCPDSVLSPIPTEHEKLHKNFKSSIKQEQEDEKVAAEKKIEKDEKGRVVVKIRVDYYGDRIKLTSILANAGVWVHIETEEQWPSTSLIYWVVFAIDDSICMIDTIV